MVGKLIKHEWRLNGVPLLWCTLAETACLLGSLGMWMLPNNWVKILAGVIFVLGAFALSVAIGILLLVSYYRSMYGRSGHFTMSLPIRGAAIFSVKVLWAFIIFFISVSMAALTLFTAATSALSEEMKPGMLAGAFQGAFEDGLGQSFVLIFVLLMLSTLMSVLEFAFIVTFANTPVMLRLGKIGGMVVSYIITYTVVQVISVVCIFAIPLQYRIGIPAPDSDIIFTGWEVSSPIQTILVGDENVVPLGGALLLMLLVIAISWVLSVQLINRKTSLR